LGRRQPARSSYQAMVGGNNYRVQQAYLLDAVSKRSDVTHVFAMTLTNRNFGHWQAYHSSTAICE
tara:strand:+ start:301 stop:495 length:195 start_codon:yes stop_codon:yes gene_type:complete